MTVMQELGSDSGLSRSSLQHDLAADQAAMTPIQPTTTTTMTSAATPSASGRRYARSKEGCLTCKRRKVKCDEQRPRCSHCERLNIECKWRPPMRMSASRRQSTSNLSVTRRDAAGNAAVAAYTSPGTDDSPGAAVASGLQPVDEVFDYANFLWDSGDFWQQVSPEMGQNVGLNTHVMGTDSLMNVTGHASSSTFSDTPLIQAANGQDKIQTSVGTDKLMDFFAQSVSPPILAEVEAHKKWLSMRQVVLDMARKSQMVQSSVLAFSALLLSRQGETWVVEEQHHYERAVAEAASQDPSSLTAHSSRRECLLAALFFLSYTEILENRLDAAYSHLRWAYKIFQQGDKASFVAVEKQLLMWIRLLDGRAVSAGGEGLFLSKDDEVALVEASPASFEGDADDMTRQDGADGDIEDVLFQVLYQPGIIFYQKVQSFMGRIALLDPWHRPRGTVEDETEVMNIGAVIAADLRTLYEQRPPLMDYAVAGKLHEPHVSAHLAFVTTRAFRTYLSNFYAEKVHLHRVAYKTLPLTSEASDALDKIRKLARRIDADVPPEDPMPVNMLWPLLMLGAEEQDAGEKAWIKTQILRMERVAGNAKITAQVLEEVQARQDASRARVDIRSVMHSVFNACFAIT